MTFTGLVGATFMLPLRAIIATCVRFRVHPNVLTFIGVLINIAAAWARSTRSRSMTRAARRRSCSASAAALRPSA